MGLQGANMNNDIEIKKALLKLIEDMDSVEAFDLLERLDPENDVVVAIVDEERKDLEDQEREYSRSRGV